MERASFIFTILFLLLGPLKVIPGFLNATRGTDAKFKREAALKAFLIASLVVVAVVVLGQTLLQKYAISLESVKLACGVILLISALRAMFPGPEEAPDPAAPKPTATQLAIRPLAVPVIVTPAGIAALMIFGMVATSHPGMETTLTWMLAVILALDLVVMLTVDWIVRIPGVLLVLVVLGFVIVFIQVALAIETLVNGLRGLGVVA